MASDDGGGLQEFVAGRYAELRRSAFLMCGDWALADELTQKSLARLLAVNRRTAVDDPDAFVYSHLMAAFQRRRRRNRRSHLVTALRPTANPAARAAAEAAARPTRKAAAHAIPDAAPRPTTGTTLRPTPDATPRPTANAARCATLDADPQPPAAADPPSPPVRARHRSCGVPASDAPKARKIAEREGAVGGDSSAEVVPDEVGSAGIGPSGIGPSGIQDAGIGPSGIQDAGIGPSGIQDAGIGPSGIQDAGIGLSGIRTSGIQDAEIGTSGIGPSGIGTSGVATGGIQDTGIGDIGIGVGDPVPTILVLDALHKLAPRCRAVLVLRHWDGFSVNETADMLGLADERVDAYEAAGLAALDYLLADKGPAR
jgi:DNA-directed RNA polymerase specialized sigma24 family protein